MKLWQKTVLLLLALAVAVAGGFLAGQHESASRIQAERDLNIPLNRSELEGLGEIDGPIYVTGHKSPDPDTVGSAIACAALLRQLGYDARPVVLGELNNQTKFIRESAGLEAPEQLEDASGCNMILVDHSEYTQSAEGLKDARIIAIVDHQGDGAVTTGNQIIYDARPPGATATIMWIRYRNYGLEPDRQSALVMMGAILSDTNNLQSNTTTSADRAAIKALARLAGISDVDAFYQNMFRASLFYEGMTDEQVFLSNYKEYESGGTKYAIGCVNAFDEADAKDLAERMRRVIPSAAPEMDMAFAQISAFHDDVDFSYIVPSGDAAAEVLEAAFGDRAVFDGTSYVFKPGISRKQVLVPAITEVLEAHPTE